MKTRPASRLDRNRILRRPLAERRNRCTIEADYIRPDRPPPALSEPAAMLVREAADRVLAARSRGAPVMMAMGAHTIKNGLAPVLIALMERGWLTHLATNGAGVIHDWEFAYLGQTSEHVEENVRRGEFGTWEETGLYINLAINVGAYEGRGYGEAVGAIIEAEGLEIPDQARLEREIRENAAANPDKAAAAAELATALGPFDLKPGRLHVPHPWKTESVQAAALRLGVPFTAHPMFGHDVIYTHPMNHGPLIGRAAERDFLAFAASVARLDGGVYFSLGSAVMSPMIFEKSMSMAQNLAIQSGRRIENHYILVVDIAESRWDWTKGEPPEDNPDYYLRFNKSFSRMGGAMRFLSLDNRDFLLALLHALKARAER